MIDIKNSFVLSDKGYKDLKKAIFACTLTNLSLMLPFGITIELFKELLNPFMGIEISWTKMWILFGASIIAAFLIFISNKNDYKKTYVTSYKEAENIRVRVAEKIRKLPMSFFNNKNLSEITTNIMGDCSTSEHVLSHILPQLIANFISITIIALFLMIYDWRLSLAMFLTIPVAFLVILIGKKTENRLSEKHVSSKLKASDQIQEYLEGIKVIKSENLEGENFSKLDNALKYMKKMAIKLEVGVGIFVTGSQIIVQSGIGLVVFIGTNLLIIGKIELIPLLMFFLIVVKIYGPILVILTLLPELLYMQISSKRMRKLFSYKENYEKNEKKISNFNIELKDIIFSYNKNNNTPVLNNITLTIPENRVTAIVGPSGSGKSTLTKVIAKLWEIDSGNIEIGGVSINNLDPEYLMNYISFVFQDVVLFNDTVFNNIHIGNLNATKEEVLEVAKIACCDQFINNLPQKYDTILGENGKTLSGGERQRISIARALLKNSPIILLDEATASLDPENEHLIQKAITKLIKNKTVIIVAHRLRTITNVDKIVVLDSGKVIEEGDHNKLIKNGDLYQKLYTIQEKSLGWSV